MKYKHIAILFIILITSVLFSRNSINFHEMKQDIFRADYISHSASNESINHRVLMKLWKKIWDNDTLAMKLVHCRNTGECELSGEETITIQNYTDEIQGLLKKDFTKKIISTDEMYFSMNYVLRYLYDLEKYYQTINNHKDFDKIDSMLKEFLQITLDRDNNFSNTFYNEALYIISLNKEKYIDILNNIESKDELSKKILQQNFYDTISSVEDLYIPFIFSSEQILSFYEQLYFQKYYKEKEFIVKKQIWIKNYISWKQILLHLSHAKNRDISYSFIKNILK